MVEKYYKAQFGDHLHPDASRNLPGAVRANLRDSKNNLVEQMDLVEIVPTEVPGAAPPETPPQRKNNLASHMDLLEINPTGVPDSNNSGLGVDPSMVILGGLALVGLTVGAVSAVNSARSKKERRRELEWRIAEARRDSSQVAIASRHSAAPAGWYDDGSGQLRWWDGQEWTEHYYTASPRVAAPAGWYDDGSGQLRWWDGQDWTQHYQNLPSRYHQPDSGPAAAASMYSMEVERDYGLPAISMSRAQWEQQVRVMLQARMISDLQWRVLSNARIEDADGKLLEWQSQLRALTAQEFSRRVDDYIAAQPAQALELATAGWYDDGSGRQRWWDGLEWTDYFQTDATRMLTDR